MSILDLIAERRIAEALARGDFDDLPGRGRPLDLQDDRLVPADLRSAFRILKNAGFVPPQLELHVEIRTVEDLLVGMTAEDGRRIDAVRKLELLRAKLRAHGEGLTSTGYEDKVLVALSRPAPPSAT